MSSKGVELIRLAERGERVKAVRDALGMTGEEFADLLSDSAASLSLDIAIDKSKVSRLEGGKATYLPAEEAALIALLDPKERGVEWLVLGATSAEARTALRAAKPVDRAKVSAAKSSREGRKAAGAK